MRIFLALFVFLSFCFFGMSLTANYLGCIDDAKKVEVIGDTLYSNKILYARFLKNPEKQTEILRSLNLGKEFEKHQNRMGLFKNKDMYISYYSGYEKSIYYFPEKRCWDNLNGMYKLINLTTCENN